jgi:Fic family protein
VIRFKCVPAKGTPAAVDELCVLYRHAIEQENIPPLIAISALVLDFLCIHPFRDGNGRVSRLLTLLGLYWHGYEVGRYISLERLIEESKEDYYEVLHRSSQQWPEGKHDLTPWLNFFLAIIRRGYRELETHAGKIKALRGAKTGLVIAAIEAQSGNFRVSDIQRACPGVSLDMIRQVLKSLRGSQVECLGRGQNAEWRKLK